MDPDPEPLGSSFRIPRSAWWIGLASIVLAVIAIKATPGAPIRGCLHSKTCFPLPQPPLVYGGMVLMAGAFLSTLVGRVPRHWVVGWNLTLTGLATLVIVGIPVVDRVILPNSPAAQYFSHFERGVTVVTATTLMFGALGVLTVAMGLLATALTPAPRYAWVHATGPDLRPRWTQEIVAVRAALGDSLRCDLASDESQLVAELAYTLRGLPELPAHLEGAGVQLLDLLSRKDQRFDVRGSVLRLLDRALEGGDRTVRPYRSC